MRLSRISPPAQSHSDGYSVTRAVSPFYKGNASHTDSTRGEDELARRVETLAKLRSVFHPDEKWEDSNLNCQILGRLIKVVSEQEFQAYVEANILQPIGMDHSFVSDGEIHESTATRTQAMVWPQTTSTR